MMVKNVIMMDIVKIVNTIRKKVKVMIPKDEIYYADNKGVRLGATDIDFLTKTLNIPTTRNTSSDLYDSLLYATQIKQKIDMEDKNMKKEQKVENQEQKLRVYRTSDTSRGIFKVKDLESTDMFVLVCDKEQTVYMAVAEEEPKYKTKKAVVKMATGELSWIEDDTLIHVYRQNDVELFVGDFEHPND